MHDLGWDAWIRTLRPEEMPAIARDLWAIDDADADPDSDTDGRVSYVVQYLRSARAFAAGLAAEGRGAVYMIG